MSGKRTDKAPPDSPVNWKAIRRMQPKEVTGSLGNVVLQTLRRALQGGLLQPGDRLREDEIARELEVSRTPVREALVRLLERRLVETAGARGLVIRRLEGQEIFELYAVREIMEGAAARLAAQNISPPEIQNLREIEQEFEQPGLGATALARLNKMFHDLIIDAARNRYFSEALQGLQDLIALLGSTTFSVEHRPQQARLEHRAIIDAIARRDIDAAEAEARKHIRQALAARMRMMRESPMS